MIQSDIEKYNKTITEEALSVELVDKIDAPVISKEVDVGDYAVQIQIGV